MVIITDEDEYVTYVAQYSVDRSILDKAVREIEREGTINFSTISRKKLNGVLSREGKWKKDEIFGEPLIHRYCIVKDALGIKDEQPPQQGNNTSRSNTTTGTNLRLNTNTAPAAANNNVQPLERIVDVVVAEVPIVTESTRVQTQRTPSPRAQTSGTQISVLSETQRQVRENNERSNVNYIPSTRDIDSYFEEKGVIGEEGIRKLLVYSLLSRAHVGIESLSGAGKSRIMDAFLGLFPEDKLLVLQQASEKALFNNPRINDFDFWVITEFQKISNKTFLEIVKNISEGAFSRYSRTNSSKKGVDEIEITSGKTIYYTLAITNDYFKKKDKEFGRRFIVFYTDVSAEQNERVVKNFAESSFVAKEHSDSSDLLKAHVLDCLNKNFQVRNPFLPYFVDILPPELIANVRVRSFIKHYQKLIDGCTIYHHKERGQLEQQGENNQQIGENNQQRGGNNHQIDLFSTLFDNMHINELYGQMFYDNIIGISVIDRHVLNAFEGDEKVPYQQVLEKLEKKGFYDKKEVIDDSLKNLEELRFIKREAKGEMVEYALLKKPPTNLNINWSDALMQADEYMTRAYPQIRDRWYQKCLNEFPAELQTPEQQNPEQTIQDNKGISQDNDGRARRFRRPLIYHDPQRDPSGFWKKVYEEAGMR